MGILHRITDEMGNSVLINFDLVRSVAAYSKEKLTKDNFGSEVSTGQIKYYIKYEFNEKHFKLQSFPNQEERDTALECLNRIVEVHDLQPQLNKQTNKPKQYGDGIEV